MRLLTTTLTAWPKGAGIALQENSLGRPASRTPIDVWRIVAILWPIIDLGRRWMRLSVPAAVLAAIVALSSLTGCSESTHAVSEGSILDPLINNSGTAIVVDVDDSHPLVVQIPGLGRVTAPSHAFSAKGQIVVQPLVSTTGTGAAITTDGPGFDLDLRGTTIVSPLTILFDDPAIAGELPPGAIPVVAHRIDGGTWETKGVELTSDGVPYLVTDQFSPNVLGWFALPDWLTDLPAAFNRWSTTSFPARECVGGGPSWAKVSTVSDLVHTCLISNVDSGSSVTRAEVQIQSNRDRFQWVRVPSGYDYVWVDGQPDEMRDAIARFSGKSRDTYVLLGPDQWMTVGYRRPAEGQGSLDLTFKVTGDDQTNGINFLRGFLDLAADFGLDALPTPGAWAELVVVAAKCRDSLGHLGDLAVCVAKEAVGDLADPKKAVSAAESVLGSGYGDAFLSKWSKVATKLHALGIVVSLASVIDWFRKTVVEVFDGVVGVDNLELSQVKLHLGAPAPPAPVPAPAPDPEPIQAPPPPAQDPAPAPEPPSSAWSVWLTRSGDTISYHWQNMPAGMWSQVDRFRCWRYTEQTHPHGWATDGCGEQAGYAGFPSGTGQVSFTYPGATDAFSVEPWKYGPWLNVGESCGGDANGNNC